MKKLLIINKKEETIKEDIFKNFEKKSSGFEDAVKNIKNETYDFLIVNDNNNIFLVKSIAEEFKKKNSEGKIILIVENNQQFFNHSNSGIDFILLKAQLVNILSLLEMFSNVIDDSTNSKSSVIKLSSEIKSFKDNSLHDETYTVKNSKSLHLEMKKFLYEQKRYKSHFCAAAFEIDFKKVKEEEQKESILKEVIDIISKNKRLSDEIYIHENIIVICSSHSKPNEMEVFLDRIIKTVSKHKFVYKSFKETVGIYSTLLLDKAEENENSFINKLLLLLYKAKGFSSNKVYKEAVAEKEESKVSKKRK